MTPCKTGSLCKEVSKELSVSQITDSCLCPGKRRSPRTATAQTAVEQRLQRQSLKVFFRVDSPILYGNLCHQTEILFNHFCFSCREETLTAQPPFYCPGMQYRKGGRTRTDPDVPQATARLAALWGSRQRVTDSRKLRSAYRCGTEAAQARL